MQGELWGAKARTAEIQEQPWTLLSRTLLPLANSRLILSTFPGVLVLKLRPLLLLLACTAAGATYAAAPDPSRCGALFDAYDSAVWLYPTPRFNGRTHSLIPPADVDRAGRQLRLNRCLTSSAALDGMPALAERLSPHIITDSGGAIRPIPIHLGIVMSMYDEGRALQFFRGLGYRARGVGAPDGLGRRLYIGPFTSQGALDEALWIARKAGFISPYPARHTDSDA